MIYLRLCLSNSMVAMAVLLHGRKIRISSIRNREREIVYQCFSSIMKIADVVLIDISH